MTDLKPGRGTGGVSWVQGKMLVEITTSSSHVVGFWLTPDEAIALAGRLLAAAAQARRPGP